MSDNSPPQYNTDHVRHFTNTVQHRSCQTLHQHGITQIMSDNSPTLYNTDHVRQFTNTVSHRSCQTIHQHSTTQIMSDNSPTQYHTSHPRTASTRQSRLIPVWTSWRWGREMQDLANRDRRPTEISMYRKVSCKKMVVRKIKSKSRADGLFISSISRSKSAMAGVQPVCPAPSFLREGEGRGGGGGG